MNGPPLEDRVRLLEVEITEMRNEVSRLARRQSFPQYLSVEEVAEMLNLSPRTIHDWVSARRIPFHKAGGATRFLLSEIIEWTAGRRSDKSRLQVVR